MKRIIIPSILLTGALAVGSIGVRMADAETTYPPIVQKLAERFGLDEGDVQDVFDEVHDERYTDMMAKWEERLNDFVTEGKITDQQKQALIDKQQELESMMLELRDKTPEERRTQMQALHDEFTQWLKDNGIDTEFVGPLMFGEHHGRGPQMMLTH